MFKSSLNNISSTVYKVVLARWDLCHQNILYLWKCTVLCACSDLCVSALWNVPINIFLSVCFLPHLILLYLKHSTSISQRSNVICDWKTIPPHSKHYCTMWVSPYLWGSVEQRGSSSVAMSRSLKMSLGIITSDCNQNSFKWTTGLNGLISSEKIRSVSRLWPLVYQHFILESKKIQKYA